MIAQAFGAAQVLFEGGQKQVDRIERFFDETGMIHEEEHLRRRLLVLMGWFVGELEVRLIHTSRS